MIAYLFLELTEYAWFRRLVWKPIYNSLAKNYSYTDWRFMNYGYSPLDEKPVMNLEAEDEPNRYSIQLYDDLANIVTIKDKDILEVGSGRGGGASYITRYLKPTRYTGLDIADEAVGFCSKLYNTPGLSFKAGNAEKIPFPNETFDVVINVESCHAYGSMPDFLAGVKRVLRPGGHFLCTDMRDPQRIKLLESQLRESGMNMLEQRDITKNVVKAIELEDDLKRERIKGKFPSWLEKSFEEFAGVKGSQIHRDLDEGRLVYYQFVLQK
jgi:ubiquinone/menaquinone biosynthesis C-methylase UbiE